MFFTKEGRSAVISPDRVYRYELRIWWDERQPLVCFIMLNPSTADEHKDDPTIKQCCKLARRWGYGGIIVVNLYALRTPHPDKLSTVDDPQGPGNLMYLLNAVRESAEIVCAWGDHGGPRAFEVAKMLVKRNAKLFVLGFTKGGQPKHPLARGKSRVSIYTPRISWKP